MGDQATETGRGAGFKEAACLDTGEEFQGNPHISGRRGAATGRVMCWRIGVSIDVVRLLCVSLCTGHIRGLGSLFNQPLQGDGVDGSIIARLLHLLLHILEERG